jgi:hypothetical protein
VIRLPQPPLDEREPRLELLEPVLGDYVFLLV